jgi:4-amino-4-deoxy-L-arabinose transferase-like glycosyltransferase
MSKKSWLIFVVIFLLAAAVRCYDPAFRSLWGDEAHSFYLARQIGLASILPVTLKLISDSHLPVYFALLAGWIRLFGVGELALRSLSIVISLFSLAAFFALLRRMFDDRSALIGLLLLAVSPLAVMHAQEIRMYGLLFLLSTGSAYYFWNLVSDKLNRANYAGYLLATTLLLLTHVYGALIMVAQAFYLAINYWQERKWSALWPAITCQLAVAVMILPAYITMFSSHLMIAVSGTGDMAFSVFPWYLKGPLIVFVLSLGETVAPWAWLIVLPAGLAFGCLFIRACRSWQDKRIAYLLVLMLVPILIAAFLLRPTMPKYLIVALPFYLALISFALAGIEKKLWRYGLIAVLLIVQLYSINNYFSLRDYHNSNQIEPWREVAATIKAEYRPGDMIIGSTHYVVYRLLNYYLNINDRVGAPLHDLEERPRTLKTRPWRRLWLVNNIHDDRYYAPGYLAGLRAAIEEQSALVRELKYVPYEETLVSRLPINRHQSGSSRIELRLYEKKGYN